MKIRLSFASDHAGFEFKQKLIEIFSNSCEILDHGTYSDESVDYPDYAAKVVNDIKNNRVDFGVLICGTGIGMSIAANRFKEVRACNPITIDQAIIARAHNNSNVICLGSRLSSIENMTQMIQYFINTNFEYGRHEERVKKLST